MAKVYKKDLDYPVEAGRYRLIASPACPFAHRVTIARLLLGLDEVISYGETSPVKTEMIWDFSNQAGGVDPVLDVAYVKDLYAETDPAYEGPYSVPVLVDTHNKHVVNQESLDLVKDFAGRFKKFHKDGAPDLYPEGYEDEIQEWVDFVTTNIIAASNRAGHTSKQDKYDENMDIFFNALETLDKHFAQHDFLVGNQLTAADIILFTPLIRFEPAYYSAYSLNRHHLYDYKHLWPYMHKLYQLPAFKETTDFEGIKAGFYLGKSGRSSFTREILPQGPDLSVWENPL